MDNQTTQILSDKTQKELASQKIAILFTDLQGSTAFYKTHGNIAGRIMIQKLNDILFPVVRAYKGRVIKTIGDSIMACFVKPKEALWAAIAMQKRLLSYNQEHGDPKNQMLIRIAINFGYGLVEEKDVFGDVVNVAGKLIASCEAGEIFVTEHFFLEVQEIAEVAYSLLAMQEKKKELENLKIYRVEWKQVHEAAQRQNLYLLALRAEKTSEGDGAPESTQKIIPLIQRSAWKIINADDTEINAVFESLLACLDAAQRSIQQYLHFAAEKSDLPQVVKVGLHAVGKSDVESGNVIDLFEEAIRARNTAAPYEILITEALYRDIERDPDLKRACVPSVKADAGRRPLYMLQGGHGGRQQPVFTALIPGDTAAQAPPCFYCGSTRHEIRKCPSKLIRTPGASLEKLGYMPLSRISRLFHEYFDAIVKPLKSGIEEERFDQLLHEIKDDTFQLCFFSFYETYELFQFRSLRHLFPGPGTDGEGLPAKTGTLLMGEDCLRVSRFEEATEWVQKALREQPNDYRPYVFMGLLSVEGGDYETALDHFNKARSFSLSSRQKRYITCLAARVYELSGSLSLARKELDGALAGWQDGSDGMYYSGVLLAKEGKIKQALELFKRLLYQSPRYYFMLSLNMELASAQKEVIAFLNRELVNIRSRARKSYDAIGRIIQEQSAFFDKNDEGFKEAYGLFQKAGQIMQDESISGLMDIPGLEINVALLLNRALELRKKIVRETLYGFKKNLEAYNAYLARFPYRGILSAKDYSRGSNFDRLLEEAKKQAEATPPPSLQEVRMRMARLSQESKRLDANRRRLDIMKNICFVFECSCRLVGLFSAIALFTTFSFAVVLLLYQGYESSASSITMEQVRGFIKFGFFAGVVFGAAGATIWFAKNFSRLYKKIG